MPLGLIIPLGRKENLKSSRRDIPGSPVAKTLHSQCSLIPGDQTLQLRAGTAK